jgi:hypothetical protein
MLTLSCPSIILKEPQGLVARHRGDADEKTDTVDQHRMDARAGMKAGLDLLDAWKELQKAGGVKEARYHGCVF